MDPSYGRKAYRGSVDNGAKYQQSPGFTGPYGPQYHQQQAQRYAKGPSSAQPQAQKYPATRNKAYSVDHHQQGGGYSQKAKDPYSYTSSQSKYKAPPSHYSQQQYLQQQQQQQQQLAYQQYMAEQLKAQKQQRQTQQRQSRQYRGANSPQASPVPSASANGGKRNNFRNTNSPQSAYDQAFFEQPADAQQQHQRLQQQQQRIAQERQQRSRGRKQPPQHQYNGGYSHSPQQDDNIHYQQRRAPHDDEHAYYEQQQQQHKQQYAKQHRSSKPSTLHEYDQHAQAQYSSTRKQQSRRSARSKSPYPAHADDMDEGQESQMQRARTSSSSGRQRRERRKEKHSVPNVSAANQGLTATQNAYSRTHHSSTPNAMHVGSSRERKQKRRRGQKSTASTQMNLSDPYNEHAAHGQPGAAPADHHYDSADSGKQRRKKHSTGSVSSGRRRGDTAEDAGPGRVARVQSVTTAAMYGGLQHVHEDKVEKGKRSKKMRRSKTPNPNSGGDGGLQIDEDQEDEGGDEENAKKEKKRRHTTTNEQFDRSRANSGRYPHRKSHRGDKHHHHSKSKSKRKQSRSKSPGKQRSKSSQPNLDQNSAAFAKLNKGKLAEQYVIKEKLGKGNFAVVRKVVRKEDNKEFAAKIISTKAYNTEEIREFQMEAQILTKLEHPNIVHLVDFLVTPRHLYLVMELLDGGELFERLHTVKKFNEKMASQIAKQIARALEYMHSKGVVHRDLKPENILFESTAEDARIKITDFGLSRDMFTGGVKNALSTACGTPGYVAPEIIRKQKYNEAVDMWAAGVIIYILLCGYPPFMGVDNQEMFRKINAGKYSYPKRDWSHVSDVAKDCIDKLLCVRPDLRMTAAELLQHPWITRVGAEDAENDADADGPGMLYFQRNLGNYLHRQRFRRGVRLIITLNRMIRGAGLEEIAREQRRLFRIRLKEHKRQLKAKQRDMYNKQQQMRMMQPHLHPDDYDDEFMKFQIIDPDITPAIDYSKV